MMYSLQAHCFQPTMTVDVHEYFCSVLVWGALCYEKLVLELWEKRVLGWTLI